MKKLSRRMFIKKAGLLSLIPLIPSSFFVGYKTLKPAVISDEQKKVTLFLDQFKRALKRYRFNPGVNCIVKIEYEPQYTAYLLSTMAVMYSEDYYNGDHIDLDYYLGKPNEINRIAKDHIMAFHRRKKRLNEKNNRHIDSITRT